MVGMIGLMRMVIGSRNIGINPTLNNWSYLMNKKMEKKEKRSIMYLTRWTKKTKEGKESYQPSDGEKQKKIIV